MQTLSIRQSIFSSFSSLLFYFFFSFFSSFSFSSPFFFFLLFFLLFPYLLSSPLCFLIVVVDILPVLRWTIQYDPLLRFFSHFFTFLACRPILNVLRVYSIVRHMIIWHLIFLQNIFIFLLYCTRYFRWLSI